jgi:hypothetical protein
MHVIRLPERAFRIAQREADAVAFADQLVEILGFAGERLFQEPEEILSGRTLVVLSELDMVPPAGGGVFDYQAEIAVVELVFVHLLAVHILMPEYVQN